jgi:hypothetical protein
MPPQLSKVRSWLSVTHRHRTVWLVSDYYARFTGARFDELAGKSPLGRIGRKDTDAVRALSIGFPQAFIEALDRGEVGDRVQATVALVPSDARLEIFRMRSSMDCSGRKAPRGRRGRTLPKLSGRLVPGPLWSVPASCWLRRGLCWCH